MKHLHSFGPGNRLVCILLGVLLVAIAGCGGGGAGVSSSGNAVNVSLAAAPGIPAGTAFTAQAAGAGTAAKPGISGFDNVFVKISKVALLPAKSGEGPDPGGEPMVADGAGTDGASVAAEVDPPVVFDLLNLPPGPKIARFLNKILDVPAGTYGKIRIHYSDLWGVRGGARVDFHPTANSHFDVHFVDGGLVIPVATGAAGGVRLFDVSIQFVGLKIVENKNKVLMRPQVFATVETVRYMVSGIADNVDSAGGAFDVSTAGGRSFHALFSFDNSVTKWGFRDDLMVPARQVAVDNNDLGIAALRDGAFVDVTGIFTGLDTISADRVVITFPDSLTGDVDEGWLSDDTFVLRISGDNVVIPQPDRAGAFFDNLTTGAPLPDSAIDNNVFVEARGYSVPGVGIQAYWISIGP